MIANNRIPTALATSPDRVTIAWHTFRTGFGYADIRGIEFVLRRRPLKLAENVVLGLTGSYTFGATEVSSAAGVNVQNFTAPAGSGPLKLPFENTRDFKNYAAAVAGGASALTNGYNRTHRGVVRATASLPFNISMGLAGSMESGFEYGRVVGADPRDRELLVAPYNAQVDLRIEKRFNLASRFGLDVYVDAINLTNRNNLVAYESYTPNGPAVFQTTGNPGTRLTLPEGSTIYGPARNIYFGTRARF
jgi:hypothetical protein